MTHIEAEPKNERLKIWYIIMWNGHILANNGEAVEVGNGFNVGAKSGLIVKKKNRKESDKYH